MRFAVQIATADCTIAVDYICQCVLIVHELAWIIEDAIGSVSEGFGRSEGLVFIEEERTVA